MFHIKLFAHRRSLLIKGLLFLLLFFSFFATRHVFLTNFSYITGQHSDFTTFSLYISDFLIIGLALYAAILGKYKSINKRYFFCFSALLGLALLFHLRGILPFNIYFLIKLVEMYVLYETIKALIDDELLVFIIRAFVIFALIESIIAIAQFYSQHSLGLNLIGESPLSSTLPSVAKLVVNGERFIRGYGTFPHPNLLSAYLLTGSLFSIYLWSIAKTAVQRALYLSPLPILIFGLFIAFSRASLLAFGLACLILIAALVYQNQFKKNFYPMAVVFVLSILVSALILQPYLLTRDTFTDQATVARTLYNKIGLRMLATQPILGYGPGTSLLHMKQFAPRKLEVWEIQPIHNYYILAAVELGLIGAVLLIYIFLSHFAALIKIFLRKVKERGSEKILYQAVLISLFGGFLFLMLFDHYFYTLQQTQILLWMVLGLIGAELKTIRAELKTES